MLKETVYGILEYGIIYFSWKMAFWSILLYIFLSQYYAPGKLATNSSSQQPQLQYFNVNKPEKLATNSSSQFTVTRTGRSQY